MRSIDSLRPTLGALLLSLAACGPAASTGDDTGDDQPPDAAGECAPGETRTCYTGPADTVGVGTCTAGTETCTAEGAWSACAGLVLPAADACGDGLDQDCDGTADDGVDADGDGFTTCDGDCCDGPGDGCASPEKVGPGALEAPGNGLDDDCDGAVDNPVTTLCDTGLASNSNTAMDYARAMDLCQTATTTGPGWGVISARFALADGTGAPVASQRAIRPAFGATAVQLGQSMVVLSTGVAAAPGQTSPAAALGWEDVASTDNGTGSQFPADWLSANGGQLPNAPGCPAPITTPPIPIPGFTPASDPVMLELTIRVPQNAASFRLKTNFMSSEFPEYVCTEFNDFFVVLLDSTWSGTPANPADKNLAFYVSGTGGEYPVGVNLAYGNTGLFTVCRNGPTGCSGVEFGTINTCVSDAELQGTGFELDTISQSCNLSPVDQVGGGTGWLVTSGNVVGGETIKLRIAVWDTSDASWDSAAMVDGFEWSLVPSEPGTVIDVD